MIDDIKRELAEKYQKEIMDSNPNGFTVASYCNSETLAEAFEQGWDAAIAHVRKYVLNETLSSETTATKDSE